VIAAAAARVHGVRRGVRSLGSGGKVWDRAILIGKGLSRDVPEHEPLIPPHGGYRKLKSFQIGQLIYDVTVEFCSQYIDRRSRTHDQMVQAARSGVQNTAEGSQASGTSKKMELKLTNVARASLEELRLDYEDFLRQRGLPLLAPTSPVLMRFKAMRPTSVDQMAAWANQEERLANGTDAHGQPRTEGPTNQSGASASVSVSAGPWTAVSHAGLVANGALSLLNLCCYFLDRQLAAQAAAFEQHGGFTERLYGRRQASRAGT
jgi:four helix bundle suffix protein